MTLSYLPSLESQRKRQKVQWGFSVGGKEKEDRTRADEMQGTITANRRLPSSRPGPTGNTTKKTKEKPTYATTIWTAPLRDQRGWTSHGREGARAANKFFQGRYPMKGSQEASWPAWLARALRNCVRASDPQPGPLASTGRAKEAPSGGFLRR